jgi:hypothetical protein
MASIRDEIDEILVDAYGEYEQMSAWDCAFSEGAQVPFRAWLLGMPVEVKAFGISDSNVLQCLVVREKEKRERWIGVEDLDEEKLPEEFGRLLGLYRAWLAGNY